MSVNQGRQGSNQSQKSISLIWALYSSAKTIDLFLLFCGIRVTYSSPVRSKIPISCNSWDDVIDQLGIVDSKELEFCIESKKNFSGMVRGLKRHEWRR